MSLRKIIAGNVRAARLQKGLTLEQLGKKCKLTPQYVSRLEKSGNENVGADNIEKLAKGLGMTVAELVSPTQTPAVEKDAIEQLDQAINLLVSFQSHVTNSKGK